MTLSRSATLTAIGAAVLILSWSASATGAPLTPGHVLAVGSQNQTAFTINPATGAQTEVSPLGETSRLVSPRGIAIDLDGSLLVADAGTSGGTDAFVVRIDPLTGAQTVISNPNPNAKDFGGIVVAPDGSVFLVDTTAQRLFEFDRTTGDVVTRATGLGFARDLGIDANGDLVVVDQDPNGGVRRVDRDTFAVSALSANGLLAGRDLMSIAVDDQGDIFVVDSALAANLVKIDPVTGAQTVVASEASTGGLLTQAISVTAAPGGKLFVVANGQLLKVDPVSGTAVSLGDPEGLLNATHGLTTVPVPEPGAAALALGALGAAARRRSRRRG